jgi:SRSO17 transposase
MLLGKVTQFRTALTQLGLQFVVGIESNATVWEPGATTLANATLSVRPGLGVDALCAED